MRVDLRHLFWFLPVVAVVSLITSCAESDSDLEVWDGGNSEVEGHEADEALPEQAAGEIRWPELVAFESVAYTAGVLAENQDREGILHQRTTILEAGWAVSPKTMPVNATNQDLVHKLLGDLTRLVNGMARSDMSDERLYTLADGLYPVVEELIEVSGMTNMRASGLPQ